MRSVWESGVGKGSARECEVRARVGTSSIAEQHRQVPSIELRAKLAARLQAQREQIETAILCRVNSLQDSHQVADPLYAEGLRSAVSAALDYGIAGISRGESRPAAIPPSLIEQARHAARAGVSLDTVLRRYFAGHSLLSDFIDQEAATLASPAAYRALRQDQAALLDRLMGTIAEEYEQEASSTPSPARGVELVKRLLAGELLDTVELNYDFDAWHVGVVATGAGAAAALRHLAFTVDRSLLVVDTGKTAVWAWLGGRSEPDPQRLLATAAECLPKDVTVALGEPAERTEGWRSTHRQASTAIHVALRRKSSLVRYIDVALLATALQDQILADSLRRFYLAPLTQDRDGGDALRQTLSAYFLSQRNVSSTAALLGVSRPTIKSRLNAVEERIGQPLDSCAPLMEIALGLNELDWQPSLAAAN
jgi:hypothetical protein